MIIIIELLPAGHCLVLKNGRRGGGGGGRGGIRIKCVSARHENEQESSK